MTRLLLLPAVIALAGCYSFNLLPDSPPDLVTPGFGIRVWLRDGATWPDPKRAACMRYLDAAEDAVRAHGIRLRISGVKVIAMGSRTKHGTALAGYTYVGRPERGMECVWFNGWGMWAYGHERIHQLGHRHPQGTDLWAWDELNDAQDASREAGEAAMLGGP
jgi:hypothetical protein